MEEIHTKRKGGAGVTLALLATLWLMGTPALLSLIVKEVLRLRYAVQFTDKEPDGLLEEYTIAVAITSIAAPAIAAIIAGKTGRGGMAALFGVGATVAMIIAMAFLSGMQGSPKEENRIRSVHTEPPMVCTAPPERMLEVPGC
ncbi:hypothetical protein [Nonomuraea sp. SBT364]|uniref:hypothetical protein n=1 Tax=Nonomuraea sp. SBT364 TaxID=1580530 RepID=UPI00066EC553|nr:hypothetical protein [Nonomuraea sp. SBT364]